MFGYSTQVTWWSTEDWDVSTLCYCNVLIYGLSNSNNGISVITIFKWICYTILCKIPTSQSNNIRSNGASQVLALLHINLHMTAAYFWDLQSFSARNRNVLHDSRSALWVSVVSNGTGIFSRTTNVFTWQLVMVSSHKLFKYDDSHTNICLQERTHHLLIGMSYLC